MGDEVVMTIHCTHCLNEFVHRRHSITRGTAPGAYNLTHVAPDLTQFLPHINIPTLVVWGDHDQTLAPTSFRKLVEVMPHAKGLSLQAGHVPHQSNAPEFNQMVLEFLRGLG